MSLSMDMQQVEKVSDTNQDIGCADSPDTDVRVIKEEIVINDSTDDSRELSDNVEGYRSISFPLTDDGITAEDPVDYEDVEDDHISYSNGYRNDKSKTGLRDMKIWTQPEILVTFIKLYESEPCLWKIKSKDYGNRLRRELAYSKLLAFCQSKDNTVNLDFVKSKINSIRTSYRKELNKITRSMQMKANLYVPKLWYYQHLDFLRDYVNPRPNLSNAELDMDKQLNYISDEVVGPRKRGICDDEDSGIKRTAFHSGAELDSQLDDNECMDSQTEMLNEHQSDMENKFDTVGKGVATLLRRMNQPQQLFAENVINRALFLGLLGRLNSASDIQTINISDDDTVPYDS